MQGFQLIPRRGQLYLQFVPITPAEPHCSFEEYMRRFAPHPWGTKLGTEGPLAGRGCGRFRPFARRFG
jgi:hypothetical protein